MGANSLMSAVYRQFHRPTGMLGRLAGTIMATRGSNQKRNAWTVALLDIQPDEHVLEIGFGPGLAIEQIAARIAGGTVTGIDHSQAMVDQASRRNRAAIEEEKVELRRGNMDLLAEYPHAFDAVLAVNVMHFERDRRSFLETLGHALKPGGRVAITYQPRHRGATREDAIAFAEQTKELFLAVGYKSTRSELLELEGVPAVCIIAYR